MGNQVMVQRTVRNINPPIKEGEVVALKKGLVPKLKGLRKRLPRAKIIGLNMGKLVK